MHPSPDTTVSGSDARRQDEQPQDHRALSTTSAVQGLDSAGVPGPKCERCNDTGWHYSDPLDPTSLEPCCERADRDGVQEVPHGDH
jgi:hypothetical protein